MQNHTGGIHHITAMAGDPQKNLNFYAGILGLRLLKRTVNFDDPGTYHFYYGDETGTPGSILTFFPWPSPSARGKPGTGQATEISFAVPGGSLAFWQDRLSERGVDAERTSVGFGEEGLRFHDPDGISLMLVEAPDDPRTGRPDGPVPAEHSLRGFRSVTLREEEYAWTAMVLLEHLGFSPIGKDGNRTRFAVSKLADVEPDGDTAASSGFVDIQVDSGGAAGSMGVGAVHHVAFRASDDSVQAAIRERITSAGLRATEVIDRQYFRSVYFREPGGVLFEIATDPPGFAVDEPIAEFGRRLMLPPWLEEYRESIENTLPRIVVPGESSSGAAA